MSNYVLDKAFRLVSEEGIAAGRAVVRGQFEGDCTPPARANQGGVLGLTVHAQPRDGRHVAVRRLGIALAEAAGPIAIGSPVCVADDGGRVKQSPRPRYEFGSEGANTALIAEWLDSTSYAFPVDVALAEPPGPADFHWTIQSSQLRLLLTRDGGGVTETAESLRARVADDPVLSNIISLHHAGESDGSGLLSAETANCENLGEFANPIGIAESAATAPGDLVQVFLTPRV